MNDAQTLIVSQIAYMMAQRESRKMEDVLRSHEIKMVIDGVIAAGGAEAAAYREITREISVLIERGYLEEADGHLTLTTAFVHHHTISEA